MSDDRVSELVRAYGPLYLEFFEVDGMELYHDLLPLLATGSPVSVRRLAASTGRPPDEVAKAVGSLPDVEYDDEGRIAGAGLTLEPTRHRFELDGRTLYTWCAWDALIYPPMLDGTANVESTCPVTGETIRMTVTPEAVEALQPADAVLSFPEPDLERACRNVRSAFCDRSLFFRSHTAARRWLEGGGEEEDADILTVEEGFELGRRLNAELAARGADAPADGHACDLTALDEAERERHEALSRELLSSVQDVQELPDGYALRLPGDEETVRRAGAFISRERLCCPFLDFTLEIEAYDGPVRLVLSGGAGVKDYLRRTLVSALPAARAASDDGS